MDVHQFEKLYRLNYRPLRKFAQKILSAQDADDVVSDVFLKLCRKEEFNVFDEKVVIYLYSAVKNRCIDVKRRNTIRRTVEVCEDDTLYSPSAENDSASIRCIYEAINTLPERMKQIVLLSIVHEVEIKEIAETLGLANISVRNQKCTALKRIRELLKETV